MTELRANMSDFGMDSRSLAGPLALKLAAARDAGFTQIMLSSTDLTQHPQGVEQAVALVRTSGLHATGLHALSDFEGLSGPLHNYKIDIAKSLLELCHTLGCRLLLVQSTTLPQAATDSAALCRSLRQLAMLAIPMGIRVAYKASPDSPSVSNYGQAWDLVCQADMPNLGLAVDVCDALTWHGDNDDLEMLDCEKVFLVQLADSVAPAGAKQRVFPGEGDHAQAIAAALTTLHEQGYRGNYSLAVWHSDCQQTPADHVARRARRSAMWLGQDVLQRSVPLSNQIRLKRKSDHFA